MKHSYLLISVLFLLFTFSEISAQGCVAIRNMTCSGNLITGSNQTGLILDKDIVASIGYRYFKSFRHFRGSHEEANRVEEGTEVINYFNSFDIGLTYGVTNRLSTTLTIPLTFNNRSSLYEHYGNRVDDNPDRKRFETGSSGLGDIRLNASYWLIDPAKHTKGNIAIGPGIKIPTGNDFVTDEFHKLDDNGEDYTITQAVDQSIQLGDGGFGFGLEMQGYQFITGGFSLYYGGSYLANPKNVNNTLRRATADPENVYSYLSVADQYSGRLGVYFTPSSKYAFSFGSRIEGIPATDLFGDSEGFRRPGYAISVEPGVALLLNRFSINLNVPIAVSRNRIQNTLDKINDSHGDAAFADYVINATVSYYLNRGNNDMPNLDR